MRYFFVLLLIACRLAVEAQVRTPDEVYGRLFEDVQRSGIFPDSKTFPDCIPKRNPDSIVADYLRITSNPAIRFSLELFVKENFTLPPSPASPYTTKQKTLVTHINELWPVLRRSADTAMPGNSLLPLPYAYIVPGGRFREVYYWDSFFSMLGLKESGETGLIDSMIRNFAYLVQQYGHIPNGNRSYYISRSQPPFFSQMVELLAGIRGDTILWQYAEVMQAEKRYWEEHAVSIHNTNGISVKWMRYWDEKPIPRQESFVEDEKTLASADAYWKRNKKSAAFRDSAGKALYRHLRAAAASGWDFSSRWFADGKTLSTIRTTDIIPVDLNSLYYAMDSSIRKTGKGSSTPVFSAVAFQKMFYNAKLGWFCDYDTRAKTVSSIPTLAGMYPLYFGLATKDQAAKAVAYLKKNFLKPGGLVTTLSTTGQQWDAPNGWAPLQWIAIMGLERYGYSSLAKEIAGRWYRLNKAVFTETGKLMEKYDVMNMNREAGGGEYPSQDGFGWTNGVLLSLIKKYGLE